jgi:hypothetical protein
MKFAMKKVLNRLFLLAFLFLLIACNSREKKEIGLPVIPVDLALDNEEVLYLKDYVSNIHYVRLSTTEDILIHHTNQMYCDDKKIIVLDILDNCKIFDREGNFKFSVGKIGQGPEEYKICSSFDLLPGSDQIMLTTTPLSLFFYDMDGNFLRKMKTGFIFEANRWRYSKTKGLKPGVFVSEITSMLNLDVKCLFFNDSIIKEIPSYIDIPDKSESNTYMAERGILYRFQNEIIHYKPLEDTIFKINADLEYEPYLVFEYGKYKYVMGKKNDLYEIRVENIQETDRYLFLTSLVSEYKNAFKYIDEYGRKTTDIHVYGIFDKETGKLNFLKHPDPGKLGFKNDLDGGPPFWPKYISPKGEMITYYQPEEFMEAFQDKEDAPDDVKAILKDLKEDDNPIVAIAKLK